MMRALSMLVVGFVLGLLVACSPGDRETVRTVAPPAARALCVLLRAFSSSGTVDEVCATADELAPFIPEILASRARTGQEGAAVPPGVAVAFSMPTPPRAVPRRRCVSWVSLSASKDAGENDAGDGAAPRDAGAFDADGGPHE